MRNVRFLVPLALLGLLLLSACAAAIPMPTPTPTAAPGPTPTPTPTVMPTPTTGGGTRPVAIGREFTLKAYETVEVATAYFVLSFEVTQDSRCPKDAVCVWVGEATAKLYLASSSGQRETQTLTIGPDGKAAAQFNGHQITFSNLQPYPVSSVQIDPKEYELAVVVM